MVDAGWSAQFRGFDVGGSVALAGAVGPGLVFLNAREGTGLESAAGTFVFRCRDMADCTEGGEHCVGHDGQGNEICLLILREESYNATEAAISTFFWVAGALILSAGLSGCPRFMPRLFGVIGFRPQELRVEERLIGHI